MTNVWAVLIFRDRFLTKPGNYFKNVRSRTTSVPAAKIANIRTIGGTEKIATSATPASKMKICGTATERCEQKIRSFVFLRLIPNSASTLQIARAVSTCGTRCTAETAIPPRFCTTAAGAAIVFFVSIFEIKNTASATANFQKNNFSPKKRNGISRPEKRTIWRKNIFTK